MTSKRYTWFDPQTQRFLEYDTDNDGIVYVLEDTMNLICARLGFDLKNVRKNHA